MTALQTITINVNPWRVPSVESALDGWLEGRPTKKEILQARTQAAEARAAWVPSADGQRLVEQLKMFIGTRVRIQFWDRIMSLLDTEGPFPLEGDCKDILLLQQGDFLQAFIKLEDMQAIRMQEGYTPMGFLVAMDGVQGQLAPVANIYEVYPAS